MGTVAGSTNVYYDGGKQGTMLGSLYGGGYKGDIEGNTYVEDDMYHRQQRQDYHNLAYIPYFQDDRSDR